MKWGGTGRTWKGKEYDQSMLYKKNLKMSKRELSGWLSSHCVAEVCSLLSLEMGGSLSASGQEKRRVVCEKQWEFSPGNANLLVLAII